ncbi:MAG: aconitate hydratase AcnA [Pseudomonadota bacterium]|nr:aconitate hydratase AcnA [Pseudomonadota bacterium]
MATQRVSKTAVKKTQNKKPTTKSRATKKTSPKHPNSFKAIRTLKVGAKSYTYFSLKQAEKNGLDGISALPYSMKVLLENLLRHEDGETVTADDIIAIKKWMSRRKSNREIAYRPARVLMQDFTGVPAVVDLAAMRNAMENIGGNPKKINPLTPVDLVIDHSVMVDHFGTNSSLKQNVDLEYDRNKERYEFLRWGSQAFENFRVVPPGTGICHQVNLENLAQTVWTKKTSLNGKSVEVAYPDTLVGTDSHTTMVNGLSVLGWGVGGIEAEAAMLGQPISMLLPEVVGFKLTGQLPEGATATDLVLTIVEMLREKGVVGKFVEFYGEGLDSLSLVDQATIANMAPEYGATCGFFPVDMDTLGYLKATGRAPSRIQLVEKYAKAQGMFRTSQSPDPSFTSKLSLKLEDIRPSLAGPKRPQDRVLMEDMADNFSQALEDLGTAKYARNKRVAVKGEKFDLGHGDVAIAAITSCTNTSNPSVMIGAGILAQNAVAKGLTVKPWVKTSLAPGSQVVTEYLKEAGLQTSLNKLGFNLVGYGCTTCIGNSGPLSKPISEAINKNDLIVTSVLSGNRNFEGRVSPDVKANYLASPLLVVAYAIAGTVKINLATDPIGHDKKGNPIYLADIWPSSHDISYTARKAVKPSMFKSRYADVFKGDTGWRKIKAQKGQTFDWNTKSTYVQKPSFFDDLGDQKVKDIQPINDAHILALLGDSITTDHISPAGSIKPDSPAGSYLTKNKVKAQNFNSYGSRRGNHEVMMRGTFANIRIRNHMAPGTEGGVTRHQPSNKKMSIYDAAIEYAKSETPLVIFAGKEYGTGSSRDWAAKGTRLLGVRAVIAESFERIHRSNLVGMGVAPLQFAEGDSWAKLKLDGSEKITIKGLDNRLNPRQKVQMVIERAKGRKTKVTLLSRIDTQNEMEYFRSGGILQYVLRQLAA